MALRPLPFKFTRRQWWGLGLIYLAGLGWIAELIIPFTPFPFKAQAFVIVLILAEVSFVVGVAILGKSTYRMLKDKLVQYIRRSRV